MAKNKIVYQGRTYDVLGAGELHLATSLLPEQVEPDTLNVTVWAADKALMDFVLDAPVTLYYEDNPVGIYYLQSVTRTGRRSYELYAESAVGLLIKRAHRGGIYTGQTAAEVLAPIFGVVPWRCKSSLARIALYGWLPYCKPTSSSARDNLLRVLLSLGAVLRTDRNGKLCVVPLWDGLSSQAGRDRLGLDASVSMDAKVTAVAVTEHQYLAGTEEADLFEGTTTDGYEVVFDEPMHSLTADGFAIVDSGPNYAILSAGAGTLRGKKYVHNTSIVRRPTGHSGPENIISLPDDNTLVSLTNARAVASRLAAYYKHPERIDGPLSYIGEAAGDRLRVWHPYDHTYTTACAETIDVTLSNLLVAQESMVVGYVPPRPEAERTDMAVILTQSGTHTVPTNATYVVGYLIGGGSGGGSGLAGEDGKRGGSSPGNGGAGGLGGEAGSPGKVLRFEMAVTPGATTQAVIGLGGAGGIYGTTQSPGAAGGATSIFGFSSSNGSVLTEGFVDPVTGERYALPGTPGEAGGDGGKGGSSGTPGTKGGSVGSNSGGTGGYGAKLQSGKASAGGGGGGGAARDAVGSGGSRGEVEVLSNGTWAQGGNGGRGADANASTATPTVRGTGGAGGFGGGGGGGGGAGSADSVWLSSGGNGGKGGPGGNGAPGIIILYYTTTKPDTSGWAADKNRRWRLDKFGRRCIV